MNSLLLKMIPCVQAVSPLFILQNLKDITLQQHMANVCCYCLGLACNGMHFFPLCNVLAAFDYYQCYNLGVR